MPDTVAELAERGERLSRAEREQLVEELLECLIEPAATSELDAAWAAEIGRRLAAHARGEVHALSTDDVFAKARTVAE